MTNETKATIQTRIGTPTLTNVGLGSPPISNYYMSTSSINYTTYLLDHVESL